MKRISWKAINAWIMFGLLLAPGLYLFGGYIGQLAGSHGEFMFAEPAVEGEVDYSVEFDGQTYTRVGYYDYYFQDTMSFYASFCKENIDVSTSDGHFYGNSSNYTVPYIGIGLSGNMLYFDDCELNDQVLCISFLYKDLDGYFNYAECFIEGLSDYQFYNWYYQTDGWHQDDSLDLFQGDGEIGDYFGSWLGWEVYTEDFDLPFPSGTYIPKNQPTIIAKPAIEANAQGNTEFQQGQFFSRNNFLKKWGDSVVSQEETWGFAPFKALIQYLDDNMLHFAPNGVQYGLMAYGYMYYALHIVLLDLVFYITSFLPRILKKLAERLEGGLD